MADGAVQFNRQVKLAVFGTDLGGYDLSNLRIKFHVKRAGIASPNQAVIRVYNLSDEAAKTVKEEFKKVVLQAGYPDNLGVIFQGTIQQVLIGRESATDTYLEIVAADGDRAIQYSIVRKTLAAGSTLKDQIDASIEAMTPQGVSRGSIGSMPATKLSRAKVLYGPAREIASQAASNGGASWSIQDEKFQYVPNKGYLPGEAVVLNSETGMIGTPTQTVEGVMVRCLLNPSLRINGRVKIDEKSIEKYRYDLSQKYTPQNTPVGLASDGVYMIYTMETQGDTRGIEYYNTLVCIRTDLTVANNNAVSGAT